ncbi:ABC transporter ATP-binding protein [Trichlorobacter ammonificans]|uniref:ABC transporter domain-containing protein n=1 Tax=Trichlorobacter ammonificans TaxID=2916410 RepID=A0ABN8HEB9_9BACT|nr:polysaccharide ABC transporter ATP-binding protein [Trichlorobacter ammonificans]CAH2031075.1 ABC transporter domain-containing protein [Trichlorobacter ammonificans]
MAPVITVENLGKRYIISHQQGDQYTTLRDGITGAVSSVCRKIRSPFTPHVSTVPSTSASEDFWALNDVSFEVRQGERIGIIGRNGAGKSTLLKILSRITEPTTGRVRIRGRVASLLEVGTGFHPELTGRENIYLNGAILGMGKQEIARKFDEIVAFSEVEKFLDTPVKRYSSGMYVRLAFAVAAHLEPEILIVDEVLAVGDAAFQKKCLGKMEDVATQEGRTILFVSHNIGAIKQLCGTCLFLKNGELVAHDTTDKVVTSYLGSDLSTGGLNRACFIGTLLDALIFHEIVINGISSGCIHLNPDRSIIISIKGVCKHDLPNFRITISVFKDDVRLLSQHDTQTPQLLRRGTFISEIIIPPFLLRPGEYTVAVGGHRDGMNDWIWGTYLRSFSVVEEWYSNNDAVNYGVINIPFNGKRVNEPLDSESDRG